MLSNVIKSWLYVDNKFVNVNQKVVKKCLIVILYNELSKKMMPSYNLFNYLKQKKEMVKGYLTIGFKSLQDLKTFLKNNV